MTPFLSKKARRSQAGFTLVEILLVTVIMGMVITVILGLYVNMQKTTGGAEELVEVQQGLRVGLDRISRDIRMAGFLVPGAAITSASDTAITIITVSGFNKFARVGASADIPAAAGQSITLTIDPPAMLDMFDNGDRVRIVRPVSGCQPMASPDCGNATTTTFQLKDKGATSIKVWDHTPPAAIVKILPGDMLVRTSAPGSAFPHTVQYYLEDDVTSADPAIKQLVRESTTSWGKQILATKITSLNFQYIMEDGTKTSAPADLDKIVAVEVTLTGKTDATRTGQANYAGVKTRQLQATVKLRNN